MGLETHPLCRYLNNRGLACYHLEKPGPLWLPAAAIAEAHATSEVHWSSGRFYRSFGGGRSGADQGRRYMPECCMWWNHWLGHLCLFCSIEVNRKWSRVETYKVAGEPYVDRTFIYCFLFFLMILIRWILWLGFWSLFHLHMTFLWLNLRVNDFWTAWAWEILTLEITKKKGWKT